MSPSWLATRAPREKELLSLYEYNSEKGEKMQKEDRAKTKPNQNKTGGGGEKSKRKKGIKPLICPDFPLHRVISLEVTEIKWKPRLSSPPPSSPRFLFTEKWGARKAASLPPPHKGPQCPAPERDEDPSPQPQLPGAVTPGQRPP